MIKIFVVIFAILLPFSAMAHIPPAQMSPDAYLQIDHDNAEIYNAVRADLLAHGGMSVFYSQKFTVQRDMSNIDGGACTPFHSKGVQATLLYRAPTGILHSIQYIVCDGEGKALTQVLNRVPNSNQEVKEANFRTDIWIQPQNNEEQCGTNRTSKQHVCAPAGYNVFYAYIDDSNTEKSSLSTTNAIEIDPNSSNCVFVTITVAGKGKTGPSWSPLCEEGSKYNYKLNMLWTSTQPIARQ